MPGTGAESRAPRLDLLPSPAEQARPGTTPHAATITTIHLWAFTRSSSANYAASPSSPDTQRAASAGTPAADSDHDQAVSQADEGYSRLFAQ